MKKMVLLVLSLLSIASYADTTAIEQFLFSGVSQTQELNLTTEKTRTEYRDVTVRATCYRTVLQRQCRRSPRQCRRVCNRQGICRTRCSNGGQICRNVPRRVPYPCTRVETRAFEVHDYDVVTNVQFQFNTNEVSDLVREMFTMKVVGENASLSVRGSKNYFLVLDNQSMSEQQEVGVKYLNLIYKVSLIPARHVSDVFNNGIQNVNLRNGILTFSLGAGFNLREFSQQIRLFQNRRIGTDRLLLDKLLTQNEMRVQSTANSSIVSIDLNSLGINIPSKLRVILDTRFMIDEQTILNKNELKTSLSANWVFR